MFSTIIECKIARALTRGVTSVGIRFAPSTARHFFSVAALRERALAVFATLLRYSDLCFDCMT